MSRRRIWTSWLTGLFLGVVAAFLLLGPANAMGLMQTIPTDPQIIPPAIVSWEMFVAVIASPLVVAFVTKPETSPLVKTLSMVALSTVSVVVGMYLRGEFAATSLNEAIAIILFACIMAASFYKGIQKGLGITPATVGRGAG